MRYILNRREMKQCDSQTIHQYGIPSMVLMERAALSVVSFLHKENMLKSSVGIVCGSGNNGGDGFAIARLLMLQKVPVRVVFVGDDSRMTEDCRKQRLICENYGLKVETDIQCLEQCGVLIDALFGIGLSREIVGEDAECIRQCNDFDAVKIAIDMPSGISADDGQILGTAFCADETITFGFAKIGQMIYPGKKYCGRLHVVDIGITEHSLGEPKPMCRALEMSDLDLLPVLQPDANKGSHGKVLLIAGNTHMAGAAYLAGYSAMISGIGMVRIYTPTCNRTSILSQFPEAIVVGYEQWDEQELLEQLQWADVVAIGPGIGQDDVAENLVRVTLQNAEVPMVVDADALNLLAKHRDWLASAHTEMILTPHLGEMSRLTDNPIMFIQEHKLAVCQEFAKTYRVICVLKDAATVISDPYAAIYLNPTGNAGMATAGSGDVLTGLIAGLVAQGMTPEQAAAVGVYLHGMAGDRAAQQQGMHSMVASDIIDGIKLIYKERGL